MSESTTRIPPAPGLPPVLHPHRLRPLAESLPKLRIPVNAIWGERDQIAYYKLEDRVAALRALCPSVELRVIPSAGHWVAYEAPEAFNATLAELLERTSRKS